MKEPWYIPNMLRVLSIYFGMAASLESPLLRPLPDQRRLLAQQAGRSCDGGDGVLLWSMKFTYTPLYMCINAYVCICICIIYMYIYEYMYVHICIYIYIFIYLYIGISILAVWDLSFRLAAGGVKFIAG